MPEDKAYQVILRGEIADGYDPEEAKEKLATAFNKSVKDVEKLLKKSAAIRKNLTQENALRYKQGLEKIGILCDIEGPPKQLKEKSAPAAEVDPYNPKGLAFVFDGEGGNLSVVNIKIPFFSMIILIVKSFFAAIPAMIIFTIFLVIINMIIAFMLPIILNIS